MKKIYFLVVERKFKNTLTSYSSTIEELINLGIFPLFEMLLWET